MKSKECNQCGEIKRLSAFYGRYNKCRVCVGEVAKIYYRANKKKIIDGGRKNYLKNKSRYDKYNKIYVEKNKEKIKEYHKKYQKDNKEHLTEWHLKYDAENRDRINAYSKKWCKKNIDDLTDKYICWLLKTKTENAPQELIELKRAQIQLLRATR